jgi:hypothetical protein
VRIYSAVKNVIAYTRKALSKTAKYHSSVILCRNYRSSELGRLISRALLDRHIRYVGDGKFIAVSTSQNAVLERDMGSNYYADRYVGARRYS